MLTRCTNLAATKWCVVAFFRNAKQISWLVKAKAPYLYIQYMCWFVSLCENCWCWSASFSFLLRVVKLQSPLFPGFPKKYQTVCKLFLAYLCPMHLWFCLAVWGPRDAWQNFKCQVPVYCLSENKRNFAPCDVLNCLYVISVLNWPCVIGRRIMAEIVSQAKNFWPLNRLKYSC